MFLARECALLVDLFLCRTGIGNAEKLAFVVSLNCCRDEVEHLCYIISFYATEDQFFKIRIPASA